MNRSVIFFELNEVPFRVIDDFCQRHPRSTLARRIGEFGQYETITDDAVLSPWVTWPTVHRGVNDAQHKIHHFGQDLAAADERFPPIWRLLASKGVSTGVFASLHSYPMPEDVASYAYYMPDPFAAKPACHPAELSVFQSFNLAMSRMSMRNVSDAVPAGWALRLAASIPKLGVRGSTVADLTRQLVDERIRRWPRIRRRTYQSVLAFDVFRRQLTKKRPRFTTFFTNHVASSMHRYWGAAYPKDFEKHGFEVDWIDRYRGEIDFTMSRFDPMLRWLLSFVDANPEYTLWIASSMGQAAASGEPQKSQVYITDLPRFMEVMGVPRGAWSDRPAMAPDVSVFVEIAALSAFRASLATARIDGAPIEHKEEDKGFVCLHLGHANLPAEREFLELRGERMPLEKAGLGNVRIEDEAGSSGYHVPRGTLLIYDPGRRGGSPERKTLKTIEIAPALLARFGISPPSYMAEPPGLVA
jgi:hypothetical protein